MNPTHRILHTALIACATLTLPQARGQVTLIAKGTLTGSSAGPNTDLSGLTNTLENGVPADLLGGLGSGLAHVSGDTFLALPDRGPNAVSYNALVDNTASYIDRFHTVKMNLKPNAAATGLPFTLAPELKSTTLLFAPSLEYGSGYGLGVGSGEPPQSRYLQNYFTGRSDGFNALHTSGDGLEARLDPESIRLSNDGLFVFISDEYGPYVYQFVRKTGQRIRSFTLQPNLYVANQYPIGNTEITGNRSGRVANKGMEGLAITPDGRTLVGILQAATIQDAASGGSAANLLRIVTIDIASGIATHEYAYLLTTGSGVSEIVALNNHEFLVDERDGKGLGDGSNAKIKQIFKIDLNNAADVTSLGGPQAAAKAVPKTLFLDVFKILTANGFTAATVPSKIEGLAFGPDVSYKGATLHTLWVANDNDFLPDYAGPGTNPNQFFVFGFADTDLGGSVYVPQP